MDSIIAALQETPIPTILVVAGIVFLLLSIAGQLAGRIAIPPERQRQAAIIGCFLVVVGIALHVSPLLWKSPEIPPVLRPEPPSGKTPSSSSEKPPSTQTSPPPRNPTTQLFKVESLRPLDARVTALKFFAGSCWDVPDPQKRRYTQRFPRTGRESPSAIYADAHIGFQGRCI
jgi:hypothetical protein